MTEEIKGVVQQNPICLEHCCLFLLEQEEGAYLVVSIDKQANKDSIFVAKGQEMVIRGGVIEDTKFKGVLITEQARINMKKIDNDSLLKTNKIGI